MIIPKILIIPGSNRGGSLNVKLAGVAMKELEQRGAEVTRISLTDYVLPIMDEDLERDKGIPENAVKLAKLMAANQGVLLVSPEYNSSIPPLLKNALDWISRVKADGDKPLAPYANRVFAVSGASPGALGGIRMLPHLRAVLQSVGADTITPQLALGGANNAFDDNENIKNERAQAMLQALCKTLVARAQLYVER